MDATDTERPETWKFQLHHSWWGSPYPEELSTLESRLKFFKHRLGSICDPWCTAGLALSDKIDLPLDPGREWSPVPWDNHDGMVTLAGDAAHSMLPRKFSLSSGVFIDSQFSDRGQGLNHAIQDAAELYQSILSVVSGKASLTEAIKSYEDEMIPRGAIEVGLSQKSARLTLLADLKDSPFIQHGFDKSTRLILGQEFRQSL